MQVRIIDANALGYAQYFIGQRRAPDSRLPWALYGFLAHIRSRLHHDPQTLNVVVWDGRAQWRFNLLPQYKSSRHKTPEQLQARRLYEAQRPLIQQALALMPVVQLLHPGAEADDVAFGLARQLAIQGHLVSLSTSDTDWLRIVGPRIRWVNAKKLTEMVELEGFTKATGLASPEQYAQAKALAGDLSDDIPGVPNIAFKRAAVLLAKYGDLDSLLAAAENLLQFGREPKFCQALTDPAVREQVRLNERLVDLAKGPALQGRDVAVTVGEFDELGFAELLHDAGFGEALENWSYWHRPLSIPLERASVLAVQRTLGSLAQSWLASA